LSPRDYRWVAYAALTVSTLIVFTGAAVQLTGSGLRCPSLPKCEGGRLTPELQIHGLIEFSNRVMTTIVTVSTACCTAVRVVWAS
jgi:cytochrome c oxidase assembly protein subunit 15